MKQAQETETQVMDPRAVAVIEAMESADALVDDAKASMSEAINAKLRAAALVSAVRSETGRGFRDWWLGNVGHKATIEVAKALCKLHAVAESRPVDGDRGTLALVGLLPGPQHDSKERVETPEAGWIGIGDFATAIKASCVKIMRMIEINNRTLTENEKALASGRYLAAADALESAAAKLREIVV